VVWFDFNLRLPIGRQISLIFSNLFGKTANVCLLLSKEFSAIWETFQPDGKRGIFHSLSLDWSKFGVKLLGTCYFNIIIKGKFNICE
jgi:hypothetical protein